jgi:uridine monophosphate synthetase
MHPEGLTQAQEDLALQLVEIGAVKFGAFKLKLHDKRPDAPLSPVYIDLRILRRFPAAKQIAITVYEELVRPLQFDLLADIPLAATPLVSSLADRLQKGQITPRLDTKAHGTGAKVDGLLPEDVGRTAVLIDDLVTRAESKIEAADILRAQGVHVYDIVVLIDRIQGGRDQLQQAGYTLHSACTLQQIMDFYLRVGRLTEEVYRDIQQYSEILNQFLGA